MTNATTAVNTVLKNLELKTEDLVLVDSHVYPATANVVDAVVTGFDADVLAIDMELPVRSEDQVVELYAQVRIRKRVFELIWQNESSSCSK